jgi:P-type Ca2+ transporter type 2C
VAAERTSGEQAQPPSAPSQAVSPPEGLSGLSSSEALKRRNTLGPNRIGTPAATAGLKEWLWTLADPMASMLAVGGAVYFALGERHEATVLLLAVVPVLSIDVLMELRSRRALSSLALAVAPKARVIRDGSAREVATEDLVPGDLLVIGEGDVVHADAAARWATNLTVDESHLSGESEPQAKAPGAAADLCAGSRVITGHSYAEITATGERTRYGRIARLVQAAPAITTPLQHKIGRMTARWLAAALIAAIAIFALRLWRGEPLNQAFLYAISLAMSAIPEEFLLVFTLFLSVCAWRLARSQVLVRRLTSVETLGSTTVICLDKTGTLTRGTFSLETHLVLDGEIDEQSLLEAAVLACEPHPADPMEQAILIHCQEHGIDVPRLHREWQLVTDYPFDPVGKHMSHVWRHCGGLPRSDASARIVAKGALEGVLTHCRLAPGERDRAEHTNARLAAAGMRVLRSPTAGRCGPDRQLMLLWTALAAFASTTNANSSFLGW